MPIKTYREAVKEALAQEMEHDERVVLIGEDCVAVTAEMRPKKQG